MAKRGGTPGGGEGGDVIKEAVLGGRIDLAELQRLHKFGLELKKLVESDGRFVNLAPADEAQILTARLDKEFEVASKKFEKKHATQEFIEWIKKRLEDALVAYNNAGEPKSGETRNRVAALLLFLKEKSHELTDSAIGTVEISASPAKVGIDKPPVGTKRVVPRKKQALAPEIQVDTPKSYSRDVLKTVEAMEESQKDFLRLETAYIDFKNSFNGAGDDKKTLSILWEKWSEQFEKTQTAFNEMKEGGRDDKECASEELKLMALWLFKLEHQDSAQEVLADNARELGARLENEIQNIGFINENIDRSEAVRSKIRAFDDYTVLAAGLLELNLQNRGQVEQWLAKKIREYSLAFEVYKQNNEKHKVAKQRLTADEQYEIKAARAYRLFLIDAISALKNGTQDVFAPTEHVLPEPEAPKSPAQSAGEAGLTGAATGSQSEREAGGKEDVKTLKAEKDTRGDSRTPEKGVGFQPEKIDDEIFDEWRDRGLHYTHVLPLLKKTIERFNAVLASNNAHAREWLRQALKLYERDIDPDLQDADADKDERLRMAHERGAKTRQHKAWALSTFLDEAKKALKPGKPIPADTTYYKAIEAHAPEALEKFDEGGKELSAREFFKQQINEINKLVAQRKFHVLRKMAFSYKKRFDDLERKFGVGNEQKWSEESDNFREALGMLVKLCDDAVEKRKFITGEMIRDEARRRGLEFKSVSSRSGSAVEAGKTEDAGSRPSAKTEQQQYNFSAAEASVKKESNAENQDASYADAAGGVIAVFDGLGGHAGGEVASAAARESLVHNIRGLQESGTTGQTYAILDAVFQMMENNIAQRFIGKESAQRGQTTATVVKVIENQGKISAVVGNKGDGRAYVFKAASNTLEQITVDDDLLSRVSSSSGLFKYINDVRRILAEAYNEEQLTDEGKFNELFGQMSVVKDLGGLKKLNELINKGFQTIQPFPTSLLGLFDYRNYITKTVGGGNTESPAICIINDLAPGDIVFCTSDGIHDNLPHDSIREYLEENYNKTAEEIARALIDGASEISQGRFLRSKKDDMTAVVLKCGQSAFGAGRPAETTEPPIKKTAEAPAGAKQPPAEEGAGYEDKIRKSLAYKNLMAQYKIVEEGESESEIEARRQFLKRVNDEINSTSEIMKLGESFRAKVLFLKDIGKKGEISRGADGLDDTVWSKLHSLNQDKSANREIKVGDEFNVVIAGSETFKKAEIEEFNGQKIEIRLPGQKGVIPRRIELGRIYRVRIIKTNQSKEKRSGGGKHYWHEAEVIGPNLENGDSFSAKFESQIKSGVYRCFAPDGLPVFVNGPDGADLGKNYTVTIFKQADFSQTPPSRRQHQGFAAEFGKAFAPRPRESADKTEAPLPAEHKSIQWGEIAPEKKAEILRDRELFMQIFPDGIVTRGVFERDNDTGETILLPRGNLDAEACIFLLSNFFDLPEEYLQKTDFVRPGEYKPNALNVDTGFDTTGFQVDWFSKEKLASLGLSAPEIPPIEGTDGKIIEQESDKKGGAHIVIVQDHGPGANRTFSSIKLLYDALIDHYGESALPPQEREPLKQFVEFVTHVDNFTVPSADFNWSDAWDDSDKIPFMLALAKQNYLDVGVLYQFFKEHRFEDAFKRPCKWSGADANMGHRQEYNALSKYGFDVMGRERKGFAAGETRREPVTTEQHKTIQKADRYFNYLLINEPEYIISSSVYGRVLVTLDNDYPPGRFAASLAHDIDAVLEWRPGNKSFWFNVAPPKNPASYGAPQIPHSFAEETGGVWVRGSIVMQPDWKKQELKQGLTLGAMLEKIKVPDYGIRGRLRERVEAEEKGEKPWEEVLSSGEDFLSLRNRMVDKIREIAPATTKVDPNNGTVDGKYEFEFLASARFKRHEEFKNYPINTWVSAIHEWFNGQIINTLCEWMDRNLTVAVFDAERRTVTENDGKEMDKNAFISFHKYNLPPEYISVNRGLWIGALDKWFEERMRGREVIGVRDLTSHVGGLGAGEVPAETKPARGDADAGEVLPSLAGASMEEAPADVGAGAPFAPQESAEAQAPRRRELDEIIHNAQAAEDMRLVEGAREMAEATERLARAQSALDKYRGILKSFGGLISGKKAEVENEHNMALENYKETAERVIGGNISAALEWRTKLVGKQIEIEIGREKTLLEKARGVWDKFGEINLYNYLDKKGVWKDKRGWLYGAAKFGARAIVNARTLTALSCFGTGWIVGGTALGLGAAYTGAGMSALGSGIGFYDMAKRGRALGAEVSGARSRVFKDEAAARANYQAEYASAGKMRKFWRFLTGQGASAEGAAEKAVWLDKLGGGEGVPVGVRRVALAERMLAFEADAIMRVRADFANDENYRALAESYTEALHAEQAETGAALDGYFDSANGEFIGGLKKTIQDERRALAAYKVFGAAVGGIMGAASFANYLSRTMYEGSLGKPPTETRFVAPPRASDEVPKVSGIYDMQTAPRVSVVQVPRMEAPGITSASRSEITELIRSAKGERVWTGVHKVAGGEFAHIVPERGHRAVIQAAKELLKANPQEFGLSENASNALYEVKATAIARQLGFMGRGHSFGFKFDAEHPVGLFAKGGKIGVVAENEDILRRLLGAVKKGGGVMKPDVARPYVEGAFPRIKSHAIFLEGGQGEPVDAAHVRVAGGAARSAVRAGTVTEAGDGGGRGGETSGASVVARVDGGVTKGAPGVVAGAGDAAPSTVGAAGAGRGAVSAGAEAGRPGGVDTSVGAGKAGGTGAPRVEGGGGVPGGAKESILGGEAKLTNILTIAGTDIQASGAYTQVDIARIRALAQELSEQYKRATEQRVLLVNTSSPANAHLLSMLNSKLASFKTDTLKSFKDLATQGNARVEDLENIVRRSSLHAVAEAGDAEAAGGAGGFAGERDGAAGRSEKVGDGAVVREGLTKIATSTRRIIADEKNHIVSIWNDKTNSAIALGMPNAFEVVPRLVREQPLAVRVMTPGGLRLEGVIKFVEGVARFAFSKNGKQMDISWKEFIEQY